MVSRVFLTHQHVNHLFVKWPNVLDVLHKQLIQMLVHGCVGRSETQTIDEGDEGQVCPCWCVQKGPFLPCQHGQSCWKVLLMKFMRRGVAWLMHLCTTPSGATSWLHLAWCKDASRAIEKTLYFLIPPCAFK